MSRIMESHLLIFQSTLSMRRATFDYVRDDAYAAQFQSTLSMRRATVSGGAAAVLYLISIHALHEESDRVIALQMA